jgi:hypothetical protein
MKAIFMPRRAAIHPPDSTVDRYFGEPQFKVCRESVYAVNYVPRVADPISD